MIVQDRYFSAGGSLYSVVLTEGEYSLFSEIQKEFARAVPMKDVVLKLYKKYPKVELLDDLVKGIKSVQDTSVRGQLDSIVNALPAPGSINHKIELRDKAGKILRLKKGNMYPHVSDWTVKGTKYNLIGNI